MTGRFIAVVGPSGVGKDSLMVALAAHDPRLVLARRVITRPSDAGGEIFDGVTESEFHARDAKGEFALSWAAHGLHYAISVAVDAQVQSGKDVLANLSRAVLCRAHYRFEGFDIIHLTAERAILENRLAARGRETKDEISKRIDRAVTALPEGINAHQVDNSGPLAQTVQSVLAQLYPVKA